MRWINMFVTALVVVFVLTHLKDIVALFQWAATVKLQR